MSEQTHTHAALGRALEAAPRDLRAVGAANVAHRQIMADVLKREVVGTLMACVRELEAEVAALNAAHGGRPAA